MIECLKIEDFVIEEIFRPYIPSLIYGDYDSDEFRKEQKRIEKELMLKPYRIIDILDQNPETKQRVFDRLRLFGGVRFYRYLDMSNPVIQYVKKGLKEENVL